MVTYEYDPIKKYIIRPGKREMRIENKYETKKGYMSSWTSDKPILSLVDKELRKFMPLKKIEEDRYSFKFGGKDYELTLEGLIATIRRVKNVM